MAKPICTIVIPVYNQARFLGEALSSAVGQTEQGVEIIVIDNGSNDDAAAVTDRFPRMQYIRQENRGPSGARNRGLAASNAPFVVFLDADDRLMPDAISTGLSHLSTVSQAALAYGAFRKMDVAGAPGTRVLFRPKVWDDDYRALLRVGNFVGMLGTAIFRRSALDAVGGFDEALRLSEDYELFLRLARKFPFVSYPSLVAEYRQHSTSSSANRIKMLHACEAVLDMQAAAGGPGLDIKNDLSAGRRWWRRYYANEIFRAAVARMIAGNDRRAALSDIGSAFAIAPSAPLKALVTAATARTKGLVGLRS
jgi:glycosyltransferase involved in cell wall biosynthesis